MFKGTVANGNCNVTDVTLRERQGIIKALFSL